jgi:DNA processing protein
MDGLRETKAYHALAIYFRGDYAKLKKALAEHQSWTKAYNELHPAINIDAEFEQLKIQHIHLILEGEKDFPALLTEIPWKPHALYYKGNLPDNKKTSVAIVGTRKATAQGLQYAAQFAKALAGSGLQIISGLALGMDTAAHQATLEARGKTFAVLANGLDDVYPKQNKRLADEILKSGGGLISEYPPKTPSLPRFFLERNRIVSGLSKGTLIIEAPERSGTLATARFATEQNREVFVIPGLINHINYKGSNKLIQTGAMLTTQPEDILRGLGIDIKETKDREIEKLDKNQQIVLNALAQAAAPLHIDVIVEKTNLEHHIVHEALAQLSIEGRVSEMADTYQII